MSLKINDYVWAKMKGWSHWPAKIVQPTSELKKPSMKKPQKFIYFFGSKNYAWIPEDQIFPYEELKNKYFPSNAKKGLKDAVTELENARDGKTSLEPFKSPQSGSEEKPFFQGIEDKEKEKEKKPRGRAPRQAIKRTSSPVTTTAASEVKKSKKSGNKTELAESSTEASMQRHTSNFVWPAADEAGETGDSSSPETNRKKDTSALAATATPTSTIPTPQRIGFLGIGNIGHGMVANLLRSGHEVTVWNRTNSKCKDLMKAGALMEKLPEDVVKSCDITFSCVSDPDALRQMVFGPHGILKGIQNGKGFVDMSTVDVETTTDIYDAVTSAGGNFLHAPVCGNKQLASEGQLVILASGDRSLYDDCFTCFEAMSKKWFFLGEIGNGTKMALIMSIIQANMLAALAESLALAEKSGLDQDHVIQVLRHTTSSCDLLMNKGNDMLLGHFEPNFPLKHLQKDIRLVMDLGEELDQPLHVTSAVNELLKVGKAKGYSDRDVASICRATDV